VGARTLGLGIEIEVIDLNPVRFDPDCVSAVCRAAERLG
jgi:hypothetical protein